MNNHESPPTLPGATSHHPTTPTKGTAMGYDMTTVQPAGPEDAANIAAARARIDEITKQCNGFPAHIQDPEKRSSAQAELDAAWAAYYAANRSYMRLNNFGMSVCCDVMESLGMLSHETHAEFPAYDNPDDDDEAEKRYEAACREVTDAEPQPVTGIPAYKFSSNDGWLVTETQCKVAVAVWESQTAEMRDSVTSEHNWWTEWIAFLEYASGRGGFRVN